MNIAIYKSTKIYIACPANVATGGPELLHQLGYHLINDLGVETYIFYYNYDERKNISPMHAEYQLYNVPYVIKIPLDEDVNENILIVPEIINGLQLLKKIKIFEKLFGFLV